MSNTSNILNIMDDTINDILNWLNDGTIVILYSNAHCIFFHKYNDDTVVLHNTKLMYIELRGIYKKILADKQLPNYILQQNVHECSKKLENQISDNLTKLNHKYLILLDD